MRFFPHSDEDRRKLSYFPFRAYVLLAFAAVKIVESQMPRHGDMGGDCVILLILGYMVCFLVFLAGSIAQLRNGKIEESVTNLLFLVLSFIFGGYLLRFLASA